MYGIMNQRGGPTQVRLRRAEKSRQRKRAKQQRTLEQQIAEAQARLAPLRLSSRLENCHEIIQAECSIGRPARPPDPRPGR